MKDARSLHTAIALPKGYIHVFGGWIGHERYDIKKNEWTSLSDLTYGKTGMVPIPSPDFK